MLQFRSSLSNDNTKNDKDLKVKHEFSKKGFQYAGIRAWNDIPNNMRAVIAKSV